MWTKAWELLSAGALPRGVRLEKSLPKGHFHKSDCPEASYTATFPMARKSNRIRSKTSISDTGANKNTLALVHPGMLALVRAVTTKSSLICAPGRGALWGWCPGWGAASGH